MPKNKTLYKFLNAGLVSQGNFKWEIGKWYKEENIEICYRGFHASKNPAHAFAFVQGEVFAKVEVKGQSDTHNDKECWSEMRIVQAWKWREKDCISFAVYAAEQVIDIFEKKYPKDNRPRKAIEAVKKYLKNPSKKNKEAVYNAASYAANAACAAHATCAADAATYATYVATYATYAATNTTRAATNATYAAANATYATYYATRASDALWGKLGKWIERRIDSLEEIKPL